MLWMMSRRWLAFLFGLVLMVTRGRLSETSPVKPMVVYVLPVSLSAGSSAIRVAVFPDSGLKNDLLIYLPVVLVCYCLGALWTVLGGMHGGAFLRALTPSLPGRSRICHGSGFCRRVTAK